jgi:hypothetical protein
VLFLVIYVILMSFGAGTAIPGGLFVPSILVGPAHACTLPACTHVFRFRLRPPTLSRVHILDERQRRPFQQAGRRVCRMPSRLAGP